VRPELAARSNGDKVLCASVDCGTVIGYRVGRGAHYGHPDDGDRYLVLAPGWFWHIRDQVWVFSKRIARSPRRRPDFYDYLEPPGTLFPVWPRMFPTRAICPGCSRLLRLDAAALSVRPYDPWEPGITYDWAGVDHQWTSPWPPTS
jgi:hypothetical protein